MRKILLVLSVLALVGASLLPVLAATPTKLDKVAPAADLVKEAEAKVAALEATLTSNDNYLMAKKSGIPVDAGVLAILAQALAEHGEKGDWKGSAPDVRDAAKKLAGAATYDDAKAALAAIKSAWDGKAAGGKAEHEWNKLTELSNVMKEVNKRNGKLRMASRKLPADVDEAARHASVLAVLALVAHADTHEVKKPAEVGEWQKYSLVMSESATAVAGAIRSKDQAKVKETFDTLNKKGCNECHAKFRVTEP